MLKGLVSKCCLVLKLTCGLEELVKLVMGCTLVGLTLGNVVVKLTCRPLFSLLGRLSQSLETEPTDSQSLSHLSPSPDLSESTLSSVSSESPGTFSSLHSSLAPPNISPSPSGSPRGSVENLSLGSSDNMADKKRRAPLPPSQSLHGTQNGGSPGPIREIHNPAYVEADRVQQGKKTSLPLPDYETLFPQKRHGVQGQTRWDHIIAEVNQRHRDLPPEFLGPEMSVDGPEDHGSSIRSSLSHESLSLKHQTQPQETKPVSSKKVAPPAPPKSAAPPYAQPVADFSQSQYSANQAVMRPDPSVALGLKTDALSRESLSVRPEAKKALQPPSAPTPVRQREWAPKSTDDQSTTQVTVNKEAPRAKPRQRASGNETVDSAVTPPNVNIPTLSSSSLSSMDKKGSWAQESFAEIDPFPSTDLFPKDPWAPVKQNQEADDLFRGSALKEQPFEDRGMTANDLDGIFGQEKPVDPFAVFNGLDSKKETVYRRKDEIAEQASPAFQRSRQSETLPSATHSENETLQPQQLSTHKEETTVSTANQGFSARPAMAESVMLKHQTDVKTPSHLNGQGDPFGAEPFTGPLAWSSSHPLQAVMEEPEPQAESLSGGKAPLRAWVSPSDVQSVNAQNSNGGGLALTARR